MMPVNPQAQAVLDGRKALGLPPVWQQSPHEARAGFAPVREMIGPGPAVLDVRDVVIPGRAGPIPARLYEPQGVEGPGGSGVVPPRGRAGRGNGVSPLGDAAASGAPATVVYYHGGGWVIGSVDDWDAMVRVLAVASGCTTVSVDYRLAPENRFPAATDDAYDAYLWAASPNGPGGRAGNPVVVAGDSAGGNLAAVTALRALHDGGPQPAFQVLLYPVVDCDLDRKSYQEHDGTEFILNRKDMAWFWDQYAPDDAARRNPYASPLRAPSLRGLPAAYVLTAEHDPLRDEGFAYVERLSDAGVPVQHRHYGGQIHGFVTLVNLMEDADRAVADAGAAIREAIGA